MSDNTSISILKDTKRKLDKYKKRYGTYEGVISSFITYFEVTNINPNDISLNPTSLVKDGTERMIKILRNIEIKKIDKILRTVEYIGDKFEGKETPKNSPILPPEITPQNDSGLTTNEVQELAEKLVSFEKEIIEKNTEILNLNKRIVEANSAPKSTSNSNYDSTFSEIKTKIEELKEKAKRTGLGGDSFKIPDYIFTKNIEEILNLINYREQ